MSSIQCSKAVVSRELVGAIGWLRSFAIGVSAIVTVSCSQSGDIKLQGPGSEVVVSREQKIQAILSSIENPSAGRLTYRGQLIADVSSPTPVTTAYGTVTQGMTLNYLTIDGEQFVIYGEDGAFAAECEAHASYPDHGSSHPLCRTLNAENFDRAILCTPTNAGVPIQVAQNWVGVPQAMTTATGMRCWQDGVEQSSQKFFTY